MLSKTLSAPNETLFFLIANPKFGEATAAGKLVRIGLDGSGRTEITLLYISQNNGLSVCITFNGWLYLGQRTYENQYPGAGDYKTNICLMKPDSSAKMDLVA